MNSNVDLLQWYIKFLIKKTSGGVHSPFIDNIWGADLADIAINKQI